MIEKPLKMLRYNKLLFLFIWGILFTSCHSRTPVSTVDSTHIAPDTILAQDSTKSTKTIEPAADSQKTATKDISQLSEEILPVLEQKNYKRLADFIHPALGLRFSPYGHIDVHSSRLFSPENLRKVDPKHIYQWGYYDGSGESIRLDIDQYFTRFVMDAPFGKQGKKAINKILGRGNSKINIEEIFPGSTFVEYYIPGRKPDYRGMDWVSLRLIFVQKDKANYLVAIVHDSWTI